MAAAFDAFIDADADRSVVEVEKELASLTARYKELEQTYDAAKAMIGSMAEQLADVNDEVQRQTRRAEYAEGRVQELSEVIQELRKEVGEKVQNTSNLNSSSANILKSIQQKLHTVPTSDKSDMASDAVVASSLKVPHIKHSRSPRADATLTPSPGRTVEQEVSAMRRSIKQNHSNDMSISALDILDNSRTPVRTRADELSEEAAMAQFESIWLMGQQPYEWGNWKFNKIEGGPIARADHFLLENGDPMIDRMQNVSSLKLCDPASHLPFFKKYLSNLHHVHYLGFTGIGAFADIPIILTVESLSMPRGAKKRRKPILAICWLPSRNEQFCLSGVDTVVTRLPYDSQTVSQVLVDRFPGTKWTHVTQSEKVKELTKSLLMYEKNATVNQYKFGVLRWVAAQSENQAFANQSSPEFQDFLDWFGDRVKLKGWDKFRGGLNVTDDVTGTHSYYTTLTHKTAMHEQQLEIMLHVSTELPYNDMDEQCLERKRHLGNDVVVIVFWQGKGQFNPQLVKSQFNHVFIVITQDDSSIPELKKIRYRVAVTCKEGIPRWEPYLPHPAVFDRNEDFRKWLLHKCINAERAAMLASVFRTKMLKTNTTFLKSLVERYSQQQ